MHKSNYRSISIAILPFKNISPSQELNHLVDGFTEDLITDLSRYSSLRVISKHSTKLLVVDRPKSEDQISSLQADYLVKGSFRQAGNNVRINAQLIHVNQDEIIWSNRHDTKIDEIFELLDALVEQLVSTLQREVDINLLAASKRKPHTKLAAYEYWLLGMNELKNGNLETDNIAREFFQKALEIDPNYSRAYAGLSMSYFNEWSCQLWERWDYSQKGAFAYAQKAVELDDTNYISMTVLGRLFVYKGEWIKAEHYLRKALRLNPNDTDNLMQIASCFIYLGYFKEAEKLYLKSLQLNPLNTDWYFSFASMLYFEMGDFEKCIALGRKTDFKKVMVDMTAFIAAAYYHLGDHVHMMVFWRKYLEVFQLKILRGNKVSEEEALRWIININPFKGESNLLPFLKFMANKFGLDIQLESNIKNAPLSIGQAKNFHENTFVQKDKIWELIYDGNKVVLPDAKGYHDLYKLISLNGQEIHCLELMGSAMKNTESNLVIDDKAKNEYKSRISELKQDMDEAIEMNDPVRAGHLQEEYDHLLDHLSKAIGLGGKQRKTNDYAEKARSAVTWRIRSAIKKVVESHESLGNHLSKSIKTGTFCSYSPELKIDWNL